jgi:aspartyl-tRNA(Asn)/glutamyl-tRNA(Gln) amidotransferase subunit A
MTGEVVMSDDAFGFKTIAELAAAFASGELGPVDYTTRLLARIEALDPALGAFVSLNRERALAEAQAAEDAIARGTAGPLAGVPYAAKDIFDVAGEATRAGTRLLAGNIAEADCTAVARLREAGMVLIGKTHTVQFAATIVGINHELGTPRNPWHPVPHVPGGSSSGSAVAVAAGLAPLALASDTGGSVRAPAALCGTVGLKTTVGRVSRAGVYPLSATYDSVGPLTRSVEDAALVYEVLNGPDPGDGTTRNIERHEVLGDLESGVKGLRLGLGEGVLSDELDPQVEAAVRAAGDVFRGLGAEVSAGAIPEFDQAQALPDRYAALNAEAYAANRHFLEERAAELDPVVLWMAKGKVIDEAECRAALEKLADLKARLMETLRDVDAVLAPTTPIPARPLAEAEAEHGAFVARYGRLTGFANLFGLCAVSLPCGFTDAGLPIGLMIMAKPFQEEMALRVAQAYEQATDWHRRRPDLTWAG